MATAAQVRAGLDHPVVDADGHMIEYLPLIRDLVVEDSGEEVAAGFDLVLGAGGLIRDLTPGQRRFPDVHFAFLEGGAGWAVGLLLDLIGHLEKRGPDSVGQYDPNRLDRAQLAALIAEYGPPAIADRVDRLDEAVRTMLSDPDEDPAGRDEFAASGLATEADVVDTFGRQVFVGCEADDGLNPLAFDRGLLPGGRPLNTLFASDIGHWDVPDIRGVLPEAWEAVEHGRMTPEDFEAFTFSNAVRLWGPEIFSGTDVENAATAST